MPRTEPHPLALFSLLPLNNQASEVLKLPANQHLLSSLGGNYVLDIGHVRLKSPDQTTLATIGRDGDIVVGARRISRIQCSFEIDPISNVVMFHDKSHSQTSQVFCENGYHFEHGRARKIVVLPEFETVIGMGGVGRDLFQFQLRWHSDNPTDIIQQAKDRVTTALEVNPQFALTMNGDSPTDTQLPTRWGTRVHTAGPRQPTMRALDRGLLGSGAFADVHKALDVDSGQFMAVKLLKPPNQASNEHDWAVIYDGVKREVENLSRINHEHIVEYITSQHWGTSNPKIFMGLKDGTLTKLVNDGCTGSIPELATTVFNHMLQALDYLAVEGLVHRDVKPDNILYVLRKDGQYHFELGDFGLSSWAFVANTRGAGTPLFMAPEMLQMGRQTHKVDVWSLYVTIVWTLDVHGFRTNPHHFTTYDEIRDAVCVIASAVSPVSLIRKMAMINPEERASAAEMLDKLFGGAGRSFPKGEPATDVPA